MDLGSVGRRPIDLRQGRGQVGRRHPRGERSFQDIRRRVKNQRPSTGGEQERHDGQRHDPRSALEDERAHDEDEAHPDVGAQQLRDECQVGSGRRGQESDQQIDAMVVLGGQPRVPGQDRWKPARLDRGGKPQMELRVRNRHELPAGEGDPEKRQRRGDNARHCACARPNRLARAQHKGSAEQQHHAPRHDARGAPRDGEEHKTGDEAPERRPHHEALRQRHAVVGLPQRHADDHEASRGEHDQLRRQHQQSGNDRRINGHSDNLQASRPSGGRRRVRRNFLHDQHFSRVA